MAAKPPKQLDLALPQPAYGGSYIRQPDGSLELVERTQDPQPATPAAPPPAEEPAP
jgi:hypothetical protein